jgi:hypothetical protein
MSITLVQTCFMVVASFAFYFFALAGSILTGGDLPTTIVLQPWTDTVIPLCFQWSNMLLNLLFALIIINIIQSVTNAYLQYQIDNL